MVRERLLRWEMPIPSYPARTVQNVQDSDGTICFGTTDTPGSKTTIGACNRFKRPLMLVESYRSILPADVVIWVRRNPQIKRLNISGNRESKNPGIGERVERFLNTVFKRAKERARS
jgi:Circularly permutated YpsA SLOG family